MTGIVNANSTIVTSYTYDAWGNILSVTGTLASTLGATNPIRYKGYYYDAETELYYLQSRYYNPEWGRFMNADAYIDTVHYGFGSNVFAYCENNPILFIDSNGSDCYIFYTPEFYGQASNDELKLFLYFKIGLNKIHLRKIRSKQEFLDNWDLMMNDGKTTQAVVLHAHADPTKLEITASESIGWWDIVGLDNTKKIKCLILFACNAGHLNSFGSNIATAFAVLLDNYTPVLASDGTVVSSDVGLNFSRQSIKDYRFNKWCNGENRNNVGWVLYDYSSTTNWVTGTWGMLEKKTDITKMLTAINNYLIYYKRTPLK